MSEISFWTTYTDMINFLFCTVLPPGVSKVDQTHKFDDFLDLTQFFQIIQESVLIEINYVKNGNLNNLYPEDKLPIFNCSPSGSLQSWPDSKIWWFLNLAQSFQIWSDSVLIEMNHVKTDNINNFEHRDQLPKEHRFHSKSLWSWQNSAIFSHFDEKMYFLVNFRGS